MSDTKPKRFNLLESIGLLTVAFVAAVLIFVLFGQDWIRSRMRVDPQEQTSSQPTVLPPPVVPKQPEPVVAPVPEPPQVIKETTEPVLPGRFVYHDGFVYIVTEVRLADENIAVIGSREYMRTQTRDVKLTENSIIVTTNLPPNVGKFIVCGKKVMEVVAEKRPKAK